MDIDSFLALDREVLSWFNGSDSLFLDQLVWLLTQGLTWIPMYVALFYLVIKNNETMTQIMIIVGCVALCLLLSSGVTNGIVKPLVARPRPSLDPLFKYTVQVVDGHRNSGFSFFSAHAANTMAIAVFFCLLVRDRLLSGTLLLWSLVNAWTRLYLGLHYPSDIFCGLLWGTMAGLVGYAVFYRLYYKTSPPVTYISSQYTNTGYSRSDIDVVLTVLVLTVAVLILMALR